MECQIKNKPYEVGGQRNSLARFRERAFHDLIPLLDMLRQSWYQRATS